VSKYNSKISKLASYSRDIDDTNRERQSNSSPIRVLLPSTKENKENSNSSNSNNTNNNNTNPSSSSTRTSTCVSSTSSTGAKQAAVKTMVRTSSKGGAEMTAAATNPFQF
jgi:hypothetical protein